MRNIILIIAFLSILSCKNPKEKTVETPTDKNINEIVQTVIHEDDLNIESGMLCEDLIKLSIYIPEKVKDGKIPPPPPPPPSFSKISIEDLLHYKMGMFSSKDSLNLIKQNSNPQIFKIDHAVTDKINVTTKTKEINKMKTGKSFNFYEMTTPLFSLNNQNAYLELNHYCGGLCGNGVSIYLKKINGKWKIVEKYRTWIS